MIDNLLIDNKTNEYKNKVTCVIKEFRKFIADIDDEEIKSKVTQFLKSVSDPYMFVIIGEVKAGKSSFINALVGDEVCKVSSSPCTDIVHEIRYGEENVELFVEDKHKRQFFKSEKLRNIAIVDTPGTDSIVDGHEQITENFIPSSDLLVAVLPANNPHNDSVWSLIKEMKSDWNKNVLFILQQKDLVDDETLRKNENAVKTYAMELGICEPLIFSTSAKEEMSGLDELSGYKSFRKYIRKTITDANSLQMKEKSNIENAGNMIETVKSSFEKRYKQYEEDISIVNNINRTIDEFRATHKKDMDKLLSRLMVDVDEEVENYRLEIVRRLDPHTIKERFNTKADFQLWLSTVNDNYKNILSRSIERKTQESMRDYIHEMEYVLGKACKYLEERPEYLELENSIYGTIVASKSNIVAETKSTIAQVSRYNKSLFEASEDLFMEVWEARSKLDRSKNITNAGVISVGITGTAALTNMAIASKGAATVALGGIGPIIAGIFVTSILTVALNKFLADNIYAPNMMKEVEKAVKSFDLKIEDAKIIMKEQLTEFIVQMFDNELKNMEKNFMEFRMTTYLDDNKLPELRANLGYLEKSIKNLLLDYQGDVING